MNPSSKRNLFLVVLGIGIVGIVATVYLLFVKPMRKTTPAPSNEQAQAPLAPVEPLSAIPSIDPAVPAPSPDSPEEMERKAREALYRRVREIVARSATYSSADRFDGLSQVFIDATPELRATLEAEQRRLIQETGSNALRQTTRALSARLAEEVQIRTVNVARVEVDTQQVIEQNGASATRLRRALVDVRKEAGGWIASSITWSDLTP